MNVLLEPYDRGIATLRALAATFVLATTPATVPVTASEIDSMNELSVTSIGDATVAPLRMKRKVPPASVTCVAAVRPLPYTCSTSS